MDSMEMTKVAKRDWKDMQRVVKKDALKAEKRGL